MNFSKGVSDYRVYTLSHVQEKDCYNLAIGILIFTFIIFNINTQAYSLKKQALCVSVSYVCEIIVESYANI